MLPEQTREALSCLDQVLVTGLSRAGKRTCTETPLKWMAQHQQCMLPRPCFISHQCQGRPRRGVLLSFPTTLSTETQGNGSASTVLAEESSVSSKTLWILFIVPKVSHHPYSTRIPAFTHSAPCVGPWSSILKQAQVPHFPDWTSSSELASSDTQKLSSNLQYEFIHDQYVAVWSWANIILQLKELFPLLSIYHPMYLLRDITSPLTFVRPG